MRAYVGTPSGPELRRVPDPQAAPNEVLVQVEAFSINRGELGLFAGRPDGWRPGQDIAGRVLAPAADGSGPPSGARVVAMVEFGGWAQRVAVPVERLTPLPDTVEAGQAAGFGIAGLTALRALRRGAGLLGAQVLITGASGGVGTFAVQLAAAGGAEVTALRRRLRPRPGIDRRRDAARRAETHGPARTPGPSRELLARPGADHDFLVPAARTPDRASVLGARFGRAGRRGPRRARSLDRSRTPGSRRRLGGLVGSPRSGDAGAARPPRRGQGDPPGRPSG
jgi:hypothetical protein